MQVVEDNLGLAGDPLHRGCLPTVLPMSRAGWIDAFNGLRGFAADRFAPGHGELGPLADFEPPTRAYLTTLEGHMAATLEAGTGLQDAIQGLDQ